VSTLNDEKETGRRSRSREEGRLTSSLAPIRGASASGRVLIVEGDLDLCRLLAQKLTLEGNSVEVVHSGNTAIARALRLQSEVVLLGITLPDLSGTDVCRILREQPSAMSPTILIMGAEAAEADRVSAFEAGADDYITKPFSLREVALRVAAHVARRRHLLARAVPMPGEMSLRRRLCVGPLQIDASAHRVLVNGREVRTSVMERKFLEFMVERRGEVCTREELLHLVWKYRPGISTRTVDTHAKRLRDKLGSAGALIETVRGIGYRLAAQYPVAEEMIESGRISTARPEGHG
jgi:two-component system, OmpR family, phosphate regulon response regulator PhoB